MNNEDFLWVEKYRPKTISETILPEDLKSMFQEFVNKKNVPTLLLSGSAGVGKTTVAKAMLNELDADYIVINGSLNGNIDTLRTQILNFATTVSLHGGRKYVIIDEADYLNPNSTMPSLRNFMEEYSSNCGFIFTCNYRTKIIEPLQSRCAVIDFKFEKKDKKDLMLAFFKRVDFILKAEKIKYDKQVVGEIIKKYYPDFRRAINELQRYSTNGVIDSGILINVSDENFKNLIKLLKTKNFTDIRKWVNDNLNGDSNGIYRKFYDTATAHIEKNNIPSLILLIAKYQYQDSFVVDKEINMASFLIEVMVEVEFI